MLGHLIASLDEPEVSARLLSALQAPALQIRLAAAVAADGRAPAELVASAVRRFVDTASDDEWLQLVGIMGRATDPGLAAMRAILERSLPPAAVSS